MIWKVYDKTGQTVRCEIHKLEYNGTWMGECFVSATINSPTPIDFAIGDYIEYRNERFEINYDPSALKKSALHTNGESFVYDNVKFNSLSDELTRCDFLDYVKNDNNIHFTSLPKFSFYASSIQDLADRIQVNLDRIYTGEKKWTIEVHPEYVSKTDVNISVDNIKVWDALALVNSQFKANFIIRGRVITIGTAGIAVDNVFMYGKGKGLYEIQRTAESDQKIITRLRAYGSTRNLPGRYYATLVDPIIEAPIKNVTYPEDRPSIAYVEMDFPLVFEHSNLTWGCYVGEKFYNIKAPDSSVAEKYKNQGEVIPVDYNTDKDILKPGAIIRIEGGVNGEFVPRKYKKPSGSLVPNNMAVNNLMLPGFPETTLDPYIDSKNIEELGIREGTVFFDGSDEEHPEIYPSMEGMTAEDLKEAGVPVQAEGNLDEVVSAEQISDNGQPDDENKIEKGTFTVTLKDIGFDINNYLSSGVIATISMKSGACGGREFEISKCEKSGNNYVLTCNRVKDDSLNLYFPYNDYNIQPGDKFVLLNIDMPDVYIKAASQRLLDAAKEYLSKNDYVRYSYEPKVDDIYMARQHDEAIATGGTSIHDTIKEGDVFLFNDTDLGIDGSITIDSLTIKEGESIIPQYEIVLREEKVVGTIQKIQNQIDSIAGGQGSGGYNAQQICSLIKAYGELFFLSKTKPDSTNFLLKLLGGAEFGEFIDSMLAGKGAGIFPDGRTQVERLEVRGSMTVMDLIINRIQGMEADYSFAEIGKISYVEDLGESTYRLTIEKRTDFDFMKFKDNDVCFSIINTLLIGGSDYYTSWMRIITTNTQENSITVSLYPDSEVPGGTNYPPVAGYNLTRRGNSTLPEAGGFNERAQSWMLSSREGRIMFLANVYKPILEDYNYALTIGKLPNIKALEKLPVTTNDVGIVAQTVIAEKIYQYDYNGDVVPNKVDRGAWSLATAQGSSPYRMVTHESQTPTGSTYTLLEQHTVYHLGCKWGCLIDKTQLEPKWNSPAWEMLEGDKNYGMEFVSSRGWQFFRGQVNTDITAYITYSGMDITDDVMALEGIEVEWLRDSGNIPSDNSWKPTHIDGQLNTLRLTNDDMPPEWGYKVRTVMFICRIFIPVGGETQKIENYVGFNI